jgi:hypothetical protein
LYKHGKERPNGIIGKSKWNRIPIKALVAPARIFAFPPYSSCSAVSVLKVSLAMMLIWLLFKYLCRIPANELHKTAAQDRCT